MDLPGFLFETRPSVDALRARLASSHPLDVHAAVLHLRQRFEEGQDDVHALAALVPSSEWRRFPPETQRELARLAVSGLPVQVLPPPEGLPLLVQLEWTRAALLTQPALLGALDGTALVDEAVRGLPPERVLSSGLLECLVRARSTGMQRTALGYVRAGVERALLTPALAQARLLELASRAKPALAAEALELLACPWALPLPCPPLREFLTHGDEPATAAIHVLRSRRAVDVLRRLVLDEHLGPLIQRESLLALGDTGSREDIRPLLERALADPARFGGDALQALARLRRRGLSPSPEETYSVLELYLENPSVEPPLVAEVLSSRAETVLAALEATRTEALDWPRWIALLEALETRGTRERLVALVDAEHERQGWYEAIHALGRMEAFEAEPTLLRRLQDEPEACLFALARVGGARTVDTLRALLEHAGAERPAWLVRAAEVLFLLDPGPTTLALAMRMDMLTPQLVRALPAHASGVELEVLAGLARRPGDPRREEAIAAMGRTGGPLAIDALAELLTDPDETTRRQVHAALRVLGERLRALGSARPACLADSEEPGDAMLAEALLQRLEKGVPREEELSWLLDALRGLEHPRLVRVVRPLLRQRGSEVRKRVVACLAAAGTRSTAWLVPLLGDEDILVARQVLRALGEVGASAAADRVADWLDHPNMNLKKTAAEALAHASDGGVAERLLSWLATQDNPGFRGLLRTALRASVGPWLRSRVVAALDEVTSPRAFELLLEVLDGELTPAEVGVLAARQTAWGPLLLKLVYGGRVALASGTLEQLDAELTRRGLATRIPTAETEPPSSDLRPALQRAEAARRGFRLKARLREEPTAPDVELLHLLERASEPGAVSFAALTWVETRALLALHPHVSPEARAGIEALLAGTRTPFAELALASLLEDSSETRHPARAEATAEARWDVTTARKRLASTDVHTRKVAAHVVGLGLTPDAPDLRGLQPDAALTWLADAGAHDALAEWSLLQSGPEPWVCARALARVEGTAATLRVLLGWLERYPAHSGRIARALLALGEEADDAVRALVGSSRLEARLRVHLLEGLGGRGGEAHLTFLRHALEDRLSLIRQEAARQLVERGRPDDRRRVLEALLAGGLGEGFPLGLRRSEYAVLEEWMRGDRTEHELLAALGLLTTGEDALRVPLLLEAWRSEHAEVRARARDALRQSALAHVLPRALPHLRAGQWEWLDVLGGDGALPPELVRVAAAAPDAADTWSRAFLRLAGKGLLHAPGLITPLLDTLRHEPSEARLQVLARLTDWYESGSAAVLARSLGVLLTGEHRPLLFDTLLAATKELPPSWAVRLLSEVARPSDDPAVDALADAVLKVPALLTGLPVALRSRVEAHFLQDVGSGDTERVRRILTLRAESARSEREKQEVVELLERSLGHRRARVRHHAHRLLARYAPRERYLRATHQLLSDADPHTVRRGIRVLTFGGQVESTQALAELLSHREPGVRRAAREGLLVLGPRAIGSLTKAAAHVRPDHREAVLEVLKELRERQ
jgi:HEAT repeat protein